MSWTAPIRACGALPAITVARDEFKVLADLAFAAPPAAASIGRFLVRELDRALVVGPGEVPARTVRLGSEVQYFDENTGRRRKVVLVQSEEFRRDPSAIPVLTMAGAALIGLPEGSSIRWRTAMGTRGLLVTRVRPPMTG